MKSNPGLPELIAVSPGTCISDRSYKGKATLEKLQEREHHRRWMYSKSIAEEQEPEISGLFISALADSLFSDCSFFRTFDGRCRIRL